MPGRYLRVLSGVIDAAWSGADIQREAIRLKPFGPVSKSRRSPSCTRRWFAQRGEPAFHKWRKAAVAGKPDSAQGETDSADFTMNSIGTGLTINTGPEFEGAALSVHPAYNIRADLLFAKSLPLHVRSPRADPTLLRESFGGAGHKHPRRIPFMGTETRPLGCGLIKSEPQSYGSELCHGKVVQGDAVEACGDVPEP